MNKEVEADVIAGFVIRPGERAKEEDRVTLPVRLFNSLERRGKVIKAEPKPKSKIKWSSKA
jgi:hypothetical protein